MKNNQKNLAFILGLLFCLATMGCKVNDRIPPVINQNTSIASIPILKTYLSKTFGGVWKAKFLIMLILMNLLSR